MQRWNWVMSADIHGRWITTNGYAEIDLDAKGWRATLRYHAQDDGIYHWIDARFDGDDIEAEVSSPNPDVGAFRLAGTLFKGRQENGIEPVMMLLTDGTTVLSLAYGAHSHLGNLG